MSNKLKSRRNKVANKVWNSLARDPNFNLFYPLVNDAIHPLFAEAVQCFRAGNYHAVVALCRASIECVVFASASVYNIKLSTLPNGTELYVINYETDPFVYQKNPNYFKALTMAKERKIINPYLEEKINKIREKGNFVMHFYTSLRRKLVRSNKNIKLIVTSNDAEVVLQNTSDLLKIIGSKLLTNPPEYMKQEPHSLKFVIYSSIVALIPAILIMGSIYLGFDKLAVTETTIGLITAYEFFIYNEYSLFFISCLGAITPKIFRSEFNRIKLKYPSLRKEVTVDVIGSGIFLVIFLGCLYLGFATVANEAISLGLVVNGTYGLIQAEVYGGLVGTWALNLFFKLFRVF